MARLPVNIVIHVLVLLTTAGALAVPAQLGLLELSGDIPTSFVLAATFSMVVLAPITLIQLALVSRANASRAGVASWPFVLLVTVTVLLAIGGLGHTIVFLAIIPVVDAWLFWVGDEQLPRGRLVWLAAVAAPVTFIALLGGAA